MQIELRRRYSHHLQLGAAFTYSHSIDDASDFFDNAGAFALPQSSVHRSERGAANFDSRFRMVANFIWDMPFAETKLYGGWQLAGILTMQSGQPFTVNSAIDINRDGNLRLQYMAGLALNVSKEGAIYNQMLTYRKFPDNLFAGSEDRRRALRYALNPVSAGQ